MILKPILIGAIAMVMSFAPAAAAKTFNMTLVAGHPPVFRWVKMLSEHFVPEVTKKLQAKGYTVKIDQQYGGTIAKVGEELEIVGQGIAEAGTVWSLFDPAKLAVQNVTYYTPFVSDDIHKVQQVADSLHKTNADINKAYTQNNITYLGGTVVVDDYMLLTNFPVNSLADLRGRKIGAPGAAVNWLSGTDAVGVSGNLTTYYNAISTGVFDGAIVFASAVLPSKLHEVTPYITRFGLGAQFAGGIGVNSDWYNSQPAEVQQILKQTANSAALWYITALDSAIKSTFEKLQSLGVSVTDASPEMRQQWANDMDNIAQNWATTLDAQGKPASKILNVYMSEMRKAGATPLRDWDR